jgi:hypothetical protein
LPLVWFCFAFSGWRRWGRDQDRDRKRASVGSRRSVPVGERNPALRDDPAPPEKDFI